MSTHPVHITDWLQLIRAEFEEPFCLRLTAEEATERWLPLDGVRVVAILEVLTNSGYLCRSLDGVYCRRPDDDRTEPWPGWVRDNARYAARRLH